MSKIMIYYHSKQNLKKFNYRPFIPNCKLSYVLSKNILMIENTIAYKDFTNGPIEGINNKIKLIKRVSFGYKNYNHLRNRIILCSRLYASTVKKEVKQSKVA
ncbi:hypothetical protein DOS81_07160 [Staphylococcus felis]|nr:hypothetical protein DOS81_07160 [Staphylococcus felis]